jgi:hypothetical protein
MRLINTHTLQFEEFFENSIPAYAILSHTWTNDEVSYEEYLAKKNLDSHGFKKIQQTCKQALSRGLLYAWVDTCCINKTSSAELTEAINSMFKWYEKSTICLAYLADVPAGYDASDEWLAFKASKWFTRGWTLQELLAPHSLKFYASDWTPIASRDALAGHIQDVTGIGIQFLVGDSTASTNPKDSYTRGSLLARASIAERMSWAATRQTTRPEDTSYCLLGIFGVNIPLVYGEGSKAFLRLQEEILRRSFDPTILVWNMLDGNRPRSNT